MDSELKSAAVPKGASKAVQKPWQACRTLSELGDERPDVKDWFRHLALRAYLGQPDTERNGGE